MIVGDLPCVAEHSESTPQTLLPPEEPCLSTSHINCSLVRYQQVGKTHQPAAMEDPVFTDINQNADDTTVSEVSDSQENKESDLSDHLHEDSASPFSTTNIPENTDGSQKNSEDSCNDSVASQYGSDGEDDSSTHHGAEEDHPQQQMDPMSPFQEDKGIEGTVFESNLYFPPDFQFRQRQSTFTNSSTSLKFPLSNNSGETNNFREDFEISIFVKVRTQALLSIL